MTLRHTVSYKGKIIKVYTSVIRGDSSDGTSYVTDGPIRVFIGGIDMTNIIITPADVTQDTIVDYAKGYIDSLLS